MIKICFGTRIIETALNGEKQVVWKEKDPILFIGIIVFVIEIVTIIYGIYNCVPETNSVSSYAVLPLFCIYNLRYMQWYLANIIMKIWPNLSGDSAIFASVATEKQNLSL
jgi:hypothetical protein